MSQSGSHLRPYIELSGLSDFGPDIPYASGMKNKKLQGNINYVTTRKLIPIFTVYPEMKHKQLNDCCSYLTTVMKSTTATDVW